MATTQTAADVESTWLQWVADKEFGRLGDALKAYRQQKGLSQLAVCQAALGATMSHAVLSRLERGVLREPVPGTVSRLAAFYGGASEEKPPAGEEPAPAASAPTLEWQLCLQNLFWQAPLAGDTTGLHG